MEEEAQITVGIKTFFRAKALEMALESLKEHSWHEVIIADDGIIDEKKDAIYEKYSKILPLKLLKLEFDTGLSYGRNKIIENCETDFLLLLDDDNTVPDNIKDLYDVLISDETLGGVSCIWKEHGEFKCTACDIEYKRNFVVKECLRRNRTTYFSNKGVPYKIFDYIPNSTLFRKECFSEISWDPEYKINREHLDFFLSQKELGKWKFGVALNVIVGHHPEIREEQYVDYRKGDDRVEYSREYFNKKFGVKSVIQGPPYIANKRKILIYNTLRGLGLVKWVPFVFNWKSHLKGIFR